MKQKIQLVAIQTLIAHERINYAQCLAVQEQIERSGGIRRPVFVDKATRVILDGHHRVCALQRMGAKKVPVMYVRYHDRRIRVYLRRKALLTDLLKEYVIMRAISHRLFPSKTTKHLIHSGRGIKFIRTSDLMR